MRDSCAPVLACQGQTWPEALDCDRFPMQEDTCLSPHPKQNRHLAKGQLPTTLLCGVNEVSRVELTKVEFKELRTLFPFESIDMWLLAPRSSDGAVVAQHSDVYPLSSLL